MPYFFNLKSENYAETIALFGLLSAVFNSSYALGEGLGPIIGGYMIEESTFEVSNFNLLVESYQSDCLDNLHNISIRL